MSKVRILDSGSRLPYPSTPERAALMVFLFVLGAYAYFFNGGGWNQNAQFALTRSLVERGSFEISGYPGTEDVGYIDGRIYANKLPGPSFIAAIPYAVLYGVERAAGIDPSTRVPLQLNAYLCTLFVCGIPGALVGAVLVLYGARIAERGAGFASVVALVVCFGTPLFAYSTVFYRHVLVGALLLIAFFMSSREIDRPIAAGVASGVAGLSSYLAMPVLILLLVRIGLMRNWGRAVRFVMGGAPFAVILVWYQIATTSSLFTITAAQNEQFTTEGAFLGFLSLPRPDVLFAILFGEHRGLLFLSPVLLLLLAGLWRMAENRRWISLIVAGGTIVWLLLFNASFNGWHGGWSIGPRYLSEGIPLAAVALMLSLFLATATPPAASAQVNLIGNGGFEQGFYSADVGMVG
ncbi:MAG: hypothetical protein R3338_15475, partial [Thermoanaerobaculia bacterium]|nr:hypothetical protein [Thermoanaerobaculia bacterium]